VDYASLPPELVAALAEDRTHPGYHLPEYWRQILLFNVENKGVVNDALALEWTHLNNRPLAIAGIGPAVAAGLSALRTPADLAAITAPVLLLWSAQDHETRLEREGLNALAALGSTDRTLVALGGCGHMLVLDCPQRSLDAALPFLRRVNGL
jgi:pimeloyl-ACP methyl ester carboxylesterase